MKRGKVDVTKSTYNITVYITKIAYIFSYEQRK